MTNPTDYVRLVYASRATFSAGPDNSSINADVGRVLLQSRRNNPAKGLVGALYFSEGCFFQCLEGPTDAVDGLYAYLHQDSRHRDLKVLSRAAIDRPSFSKWAMKYVPNAIAVSDLLSRHGLRSFDPYSFSPAVLADMVNLLLQGSDVVVADTQPIAPSATTQALAIARQAQLVAFMALVASLIAVGVSALR